jgi:protease-4
MRKFVFILSVLLLSTLAAADLFPAVANDLNSIPATADSAAGMWTNPAAAGLPRGFQLGSDFLVGMTGQSLWDIYMGGILGGIGYRQYHRDDNVATFFGNYPGGGSTFSDFCWTPAFGNDFGGLGFGLHWISSDGPGKPHGFAWTPGFIARPLRWTSLGVVAENVTEPRFGSIKYPRAYQISMGVRPGVDFITVAANAHFDRDFHTDNIAWEYALGVEPIPGLQVSGVYRPQPASDNAAMLNLPNGFSPFADRFMAGISFNMPYMGVGYSRLQSTDKYDVSGNMVNLRLNLKRYPTVIRLGRRFAVLTVDGRMTDSPSGWSLFSGRNPSLVDALEQLRTIENDSELAGVILKIGDMGSRMGISAQAEEIHREIGILRGKGKVAVAYLEFTTKPTPYYLATACNSIVMPAEGELGGLGTYLEVHRLDELGRKLGIGVDVVHAGKYKLSTFFFGPALNDEQKEELQSIVDSEYDILIDAIVEARKLDKEAVRKLCDGLMMRSQMAKDAGLVDEIGDWYYCKQVAARLAKMGSKPTKIAKIADWEYLPSRWGEPPVVAVIMLEGMITEGRSGNDGLLGKIIGSDTVVKQLEQCEKNPMVKAVVLRVNSPGGSSLASDYINSAVWRLRDKGKPVVASYSNIAASGGYYVSCGCNEIYSDESTITGSIGVFSLKPTIGELFEKIGVTTETVKQGQSADMYSFSRPWTEAEKARVQELTDASYQSFVEKVATGRKMSVDDVKKVAEGRIWSGRQAMDIKLVDKFGGLNEAVKRAATLAGVSEEPEVIYLTGRRPFFSIGYGWSDYDFEVPLGNYYYEPIQP